MNGSKGQTCSFLFLSSDNPDLEWIIPNIHKDYRL